MPLHDWTKVEPNFFQPMHLAWISELQRQLNRGLLPAKYTAMAEVIVHGFAPDVIALGAVDEPDNAGDDPALPTLAKPAIQVVATASRKRSSQQFQRRIVIRLRGFRQIVSIIEVVSPSNKDTTANTRQFVEKSVSFLQNDVHVVILDLFPSPARDKYGLHGEVWEELVGRRSKLPRHTRETRFFSSIVAKANGEYDLYAEPRQLGETLPELPLFLKPDLFVNLPLELSYQNAFLDVSADIREAVTPTT